MSYCAAGIGSYWRPHEKEAVDKYFGNEQPNLEADYFIWRHNTECVSVGHYNQSVNIENDFLSTGNNKIINPMSSYKYTNNKDSCFEVWEKENVSSPKFFTYENRGEFEEKRIDFPFLLRLNDGVTGEDTYLIESEEDLEEDYPKVDMAYASKQRIDTKKICVQFIDTTIASGYKTSFRLAVAGDSVISGYARISDDWLAITKQFTEDKKQSFVEQNKRVQNLIKDNHDEIVKCVQSLGLHHVGVDMIADSNDKIYFLEVQPFYFCGNTSRTKAPFWNPYKPQELVDWLVNDKKELYKDMSMYYDKWLDKKNHFDDCYSSLRRYFDVRSK